MAGSKRLRAAQDAHNRPGSVSCKRRRTLGAQEAGIKMPKEVRRKMMNEEGQGWRINRGNHPQLVGWSTTSLSRRGWPQGLGLLIAPWSQGLGHLKGDSGSPAIAFEWLEKGAEENNCGPHGRVGTPAMKALTQ